MATISNPYGVGNDGSFARFVAVTPSDTTDLAAGPARGLYVGVAGDVALVGLDDAAVVFKALPVGLHKVIFRRVNATATAATNMVAMY
jgi:hypothetical protein